MKLVNWINRHITHPRDDEKDYGIRVVMHTFPGFLVGLIPPPFDNNAVKLFLRYEKNEDKWTQDEAWKDVGGFLIGYVSGRVVLVIALIILIVKVVQYAGYN